MSSLGLRCGTQNERLQSLKKDKRPNKNGTSAPIKTDRRPEQTPHGRGPADREPVAPRSAQSPLRETRPPPQEGSSAHPVGRRTVGDVRTLPVAGSTAQPLGHTLQQDVQSRPGTTQNPRRRLPQAMLCGVLSGSGSSQARTRRTLGAQGHVSTGQGGVGGKGTSLGQVQYLPE